jgi:hypothetical protein
MAQLCLAATLILHIVKIYRRQLSYRYPQKHNVNIMACRSKGMLKDLHLESLTERLKQSFLQRCIIRSGQSCLSKHSRQLNKSPRKFHIRMWVGLRFNVNSASQAVWAARTSISLFHRFLQHLLIRTDLGSLLQLDVAKEL